MNSLYKQNLSCKYEEICYININYGYRILRIRSLFKSFQSFILPLNVHTQGRIFSGLIHSIVLVLVFGAILSYL